MKKEGISIVIINYNSSKDTYNAIKSFIKHEADYYNKNLLEFIIIDNDSNNDNIKILREIKNNYKNINIFETKENNGFGKGNNIGVEKCKYENILFFNADAYIIEPIIDKGIKMLNLQSVGIIGVQLLNTNYTKQVSCGYFPSIKQNIMEIIGLYKIKSIFKFTKPFAFSLPDKYKFLDIDYISGACFFMKKKVFKKIEGFDEKFFLYYEETDLCKRVKNIGLRIIIIQSKSVIHVGSSITGQFSIFKAKCFYESYIKFIFKHYEFYKIMYYFNCIILLQKIIMSKILYKKLKVNYYRIGLQTMKKKILQLEKSN